MKKIVLFFCIFLTACTGRYASLENTMQSCGFNNAPYKKFHSCMNEKVTVNEKGPKDYYYKSNKEILALLDGYDQKLKKKKIKEKAIYSEFGQYVSTKKQEEAQSAQTAGVIIGVALLGVAVAACAHNECLADSGSNGYYYNQPPMCSSCPYCTKHCNIGKACGNTCISVLNECHVGAGSACNINWRHYP